MQAIKLTTKFFAIVAIVAVAFGPFGAIQSAQVAHATTCVGVGLRQGVSQTVPDGQPCPSPLVDSARVSQDQAGNQVLNPSQTGQESVVYNNSSGLPIGQPGTKPTPPSSSDCSGITGCLASMVYYIGPGFASWVASWSAYFFDLIVRISLSSNAYTLTFLTESWNLVLSLANMFFIFILIYAAFVIMLRAETARTLQTLAWVIAIALVVNFSFFFTRVVIDAGNILGTQFYNAVAFQPGVTSIQAGDNAAVAGTPDITAPIMQAIGVENLIGGQSFALISQKLGDDKWGALIILSVIFIFAAVMFWVLAIALLMVGLKFFLRIVGLWLILVAAPLAFVAQTLSNTRHLFTAWLRALVSLSMYPAVFLFMFWVLNQFAAQLAGGTDSIQSKLLGTNASAALSQAVGASGANAGANSYTLLVLIANVSIRMMFIITLLYVMLKVSDWIIEQAGGFATNLVSHGSAMLLGGGFRTAAWAGAFAGRNTAGRVANRLAQNGAVSQALNSNRLGRALWRGTVGASRSTFDIRNAPGASIVGSRPARELMNTTLVNSGKASTKNAADEAKRIAQLNKRLAKQAAAATKQQQQQAQQQQQTQPQQQTQNTNQNQPRQPIFNPVSQWGNKNAQNIINPPSQWGTPGGQPVVNPTSQWKAPSVQMGTPQAVRNLFMQAQGERIKQATKAAPVAASLIGQPNMNLNPRAAAQIAAAHTPPTAQQKTEPVIQSAPSVAQTVAAVQGNGPMPQRVEVVVPTQINTHTERVIEVHEVHSSPAEAAKSVTHEELRNAVRQLASKVSKEVHGAAAHIDSHMDDVAHRQNIETRDEFGKLKKEIKTEIKHTPDDDNNGPGGAAAAKPKPIEPLDKDDIPPHYREAAE